MDRRTLAWLFGCVAAYAAGCNLSTKPTGSATGAQLCTSDADCVSGQSCMPEDGGRVCVSSQQEKHGGSAGASATASASACTSNADCPNGECEIENGAGYCKPQHEDADRENDAGDEHETCEGDAGYDCKGGDHGEDHGDRGEDDAGMTERTACEYDAGCACAHGDGHGGDGDSRCSSSEGDGDHSSDGR